MPRHLASRPALPILTVIALLLSAVAILAAPSPVAAQTELIADLTGAEEVPGPGDDDGGGFVSVMVDPAGGQVCVFLEVGAIAPATAAHIHEGAIGLAGSVVVTLPTPNAEGIADGCVSGLDMTLLETIEADPAAYYVNVHNADFPDGAVRGQLGLPPAFVVAQTLSGAAEIPGPGDPDGIGFADLQIFVEAGEICGFIGVENIAAATAAHIHEGATGVAGPVVVTLFTPGSDGVGEGCVDGLDPALLQLIADTPRAYYVNVHNAEYPDGALRGQLTEPPITVFATLAGAAEVPGPGDPDGRGFARVDLFPAAGQVCVVLEVSAIAPATAAHIHQGAADVAGDIVVTLPTPNADGFSDGCVDGLDPALVEAIANDPAGFYVNVHTSDFPAGAIRGQLTFEPQPPPPCPAGELCEAGEIGPGTYTYTGFRTDLTFTTTSTWFFSSDDIPSMNLFDLDVRGGLFGFPFVGSVYTDPCSFESLGTIGDSPAELMAWLGDRSFLDLSAPISVNYGGASGLQVDLLGVNLPAECTDPPWVLVFGLPIVGDFHFEAGSTGRIIALDVAGETILFITEHVAESPGTGGDPAAAFLARAQGVVDSFVWALGGGPVLAPSGSPAPLPDTTVGMPASGGPVGLPGVLGAIFIVSAMWIVVARRRV